jgi:HTH-type transcriptional repressor of NAD biosynthesis genes
VKRFRRGLVVGKFSPLHRGHQLVIDRAFADCDEVVILSYTKPEFAGCEPERRAGWLAALYPSARRLVVTDGLLCARGLDITVPHNDANETVHRRFCGWLCRDVLEVTVDAVFTSEDYGPGFAAELTAFFREGDPRFGGVAHVLVDKQRTSVPISGTAIRAEVHAHRASLSSEVYASFVQRVALLGGESTGKSTLAKALAEALRTISVDEYGRELWVQKDGKLVFEDLQHIGEEQVRREEAALRTSSANRHLICDTTPLTTLFYSDALFGKVAPGLAVLAGRPYDLTVLCEPDFPFVQDGTRQQPDFRDRQHRWYLERLNAQGSRLVRVGGTVAQRVSQVIDALG